MLAGNVGQPSDFLEDQERSLSHSSTYVPKPQVGRLICASSNSLTTQRSLFLSKFLIKSFYWLSRLTIMLSLQSQTFLWLLTSFDKLPSNVLCHDAISRDSTFGGTRISQECLRGFGKNICLNFCVLLKPDDSNRTLLCFSNISTLSKHNFSWNIFENLQELQIDLYHENLKTQTRCVKAIFSDKFFVLQILKLTEVPRIDTHLLGLISSACPGLTRLELSSVEALRRAICCWNCWQNATSLVVHSPIPSKYRCAEDLAVSGALTRLWLVSRPFS